MVISQLKVIKLDAAATNQIQSIYEETEYNYIARKFSPWLELSPTTLELPCPVGLGFDEFPRLIPRFGQSPPIAPNNKILMLQDFDFATLCARVCLRLHSL